MTFYAQPVTITKYLLSTKAQAYVKGQRTAHIVARHSPNGTTFTLCGQEFQKASSHTITVLDKKSHSLCRMCERHQVKRFAF